MNRPELAHDIWRRWGKGAGAQAFKHFIGRGRGHVLRSEELESTGETRIVRFLVEIHELEGEDVPGPDPQEQWE